MTVLSGCHSAALKTAQSGAVPVGPGHSGAGGGGRTLAADESDNGRSIAAAVGDLLVVTLHSTYWQFAEPAGGAILRATGPVSIAPTRRTRCVPGQGCGTVTESFRAMSAGRVVITAKRTSCGEARACTGKSGSYQVSVVVG